VVQGVGRREGGLRRRGVQVGGTREKELRRGGGSKREARGREEGGKGSANVFVGRGLMVFSMGFIKISELTTLGFRRKSTFCYVVVCCSVLQCVAVCYSVLQCVAVC